MGRGIRVQIFNNTEYPLHANIEELDDIKRSGGGSNPAGLVGDLKPHSKLPADQAQYIENYSAVRDGKFTIVVRVADGAEEVGRLCFRGSNTGFRNTWRKVYRDDILVDALMADNLIEITIDGLRTVGNKLPYMKLAFNEDAALIGEHDREVELAKDFVRRNGLTDVMFFAHGFNNSQRDAFNVYQSYFERFKTPGSDKKLGIIGITWPSQSADAADGASDIANIAVGALKFAAFYSKHGLAGKVGHHLGWIVNAVSNANPSAAIHLAGHSMGGHLMLSAIPPLTAPERVKSIFLIQAATAAGALGWSNVKPQLKKIGGPIVATHSLEDMQVVALWTGAQGLKALTPLGNGADIPAMGAFGATDCDARDLTLGDANARYDFAAGTAHSLHCPTLSNHDKYKTDAFARAHQLAAGLV